MSRRMYGILVLLAPLTCAATVCPQASNAIGNCGFEVDTANWSVPIGDSITRTTAVSHSGVASAQVDASESGTLLIRSTCLSLTSSANYGFGAFVRHVSGTAPSSCKAQLRQNSDVACSQSVSFMDTPLLPVNTTSWSGLFRSITSLGTTQSGWLDVSCIGGDDSTMVVIDDVFLGIGLEPPLFGNGFE